jgi:RNA polymerase primary sigma factor
MGTDEPLPPSSSDENDPLRHQGLVGWVAKHYVDRGIEFEDLMQQGELGLLEAIVRYDPARHTKFATYAPYWVRRLILEAIKNQARPIRVPVYMRNRLHQGITADSPGLTARQRANIKAAWLVIYGQVGADPTAVDRLPAGAGDDEGSELDRNFAADVAPRLAFLTARERQALALTFGLDGAEPLSARQVAKACHLSHQRIVQLVAEAIRKLRVDPTHEGG